MNEFRYSTVALLRLFRMMGRSGSDKGRALKIGCSSWVIATPPYFPSKIEDVHSSLRRARGCYNEKKHGYKP